MNCSHIFSEIDSLCEEYVGVWEDICSIESPSRDKVRVDAVGDYLVALANKLGFEVERYPEERFGDVISVTMNADSKNAPVTISGHMDTVHPVGLFGTPAVKREGDKLFGPGTMDCKGGIAAGFLAMHALKRCGYTARPVRMLLQSNEEIGSGLDCKGPIERICDISKDSVAFLNLEGHEGFFENKACLKRKGSARFSLKIKGVAAHGAYCAVEGANAIVEASHKVIELDKYRSDDGLTINCGIISGGSVVNTVPDSCEVKIDVRYAKAEQFEEALAIIDRVANETHVEGCTCEVTMTAKRVAMEPCEKSLALLELANKALVENGLAPLEVGERRGGSDASDITSCGIPCLDSLGVGGERAHSVEEYGVISSLPESAKRIVSIVTVL